MRSKQWLRIVTILVVPVLVITTSVRHTFAELITTEEALRVTSVESERVKVSEFIAQEEVRGVLLKAGVSQDEIMGRLAALSDAEILKLSELIDSAPAGGNGIGTVVVALLVVFLVLLLTDILGFTRVYHFTRPVSAR